MILNHDDSESQVSREMHDGVFVRSVYFFDPDGILLEFAALDPDVRPRPTSRSRPARSLARQ